MNNIPVLPPHPALVSLDDLLAKLSGLKNAGKKIVFTNGCYDIIHPGHVDLLERAKALGDILVLGLNSDASVRRQEKGNERPIVSYPARAFVLAHLSSVDYVVEFDENTPLNLILAVRPDILVKGGDWTPDKIVGAAEVESRGGKVHSLPLLSGFSTTAIVNKLIASK